MDARPLISAAYEATNPFRAPDWRWRYARQAVAAGRRPSRRKYDAETLTLIAYQRAAQRGDPDRVAERLERRWPGLPAAERLAAEVPLRFEVQARLIAGQSDDEIAGHCGLAPEVVRWFEIAFCNVRDRLRARDWLVLRVIRPTEDGAILPDECSRVWMQFALAGPIVLDVVLAVTAGRPMPAWVRASATGDPDYEEARVRLKTKIAIAVLTARTPEELRPAIEAHQKLRRLEGSAASAEDRSARLLTILGDFLKALGRPRSQRKKPAPPRKRTATRWDSAPSPDAGRRTPVPLHELST